MKTDKWLFSSDKTKMGKKGKYLVIPFKHDDKGGSSESETAKFKQQLTGRIKEELELQNKLRKAAGLPKIILVVLETKSNQKDMLKEGNLHTFDIFGSREKPQLVGYAINWTKCLPKN